MTSNQSNGISENRVQRAAALHTFFPRWFEWHLASFEFVALRFTLETMISCEWQKLNAIMIGWWYRQGYRCPNKAKAPSSRPVTRAESCPGTKLISLYYYMPRDCHLINLYYISVRRCSIVDARLSKLSIDIVPEGTFPKGNLFHITDSLLASK